MCACVNIKKLTEEFILATRNGLEWQNIQLICFQLPSLWLASSHPHPRSNVAFFVQEEWTAQ